MGNQLTSYGRRWNEFFFFGKCYACMLIDADACNFLNFYAKMKCHVMHFFLYFWYAKRMQCHVFFCNMVSKARVCMTNISDFFLTHGSHPAWSRVLKEFLDTVPKVIDSPRMIFAYGKYSRASIPSRESTMSEVLVLTLTRHPPRGHTLHNHHP